MDAATQPSIAVLLLAESFSRVWDGLAPQVGARVRAAGSLDELAPLSGACAVVVSAAGAEELAAESLEEVRSRGGREIAVVGSADGHRIAVTVLAAGATNYFALPGDLQMLTGWLRERVERVRDAEQSQRRLTHERTRYDFSRIIGESPVLRHTLERVSRVIPHASPVLIRGETGTGKELLAQAIHYNGPRSRGPFVEVNCAAIPETLLEAELFGYEKGAFTDARVAKPGLFEAAHGGTLFLDEIGELSPALQAKLLKVIEDKQVRRVGSVRTLLVDVRIIAATHANLQERVRSGTFRQDLYFRLNVFQAELPPLRERGLDVVVLAEHFLDHFSRAYEMPCPTLAPEVRGALTRYPWPGNVRELSNAIERAVALGDGGLPLEEIFPESEKQPVSSPTQTIPFPATLAEITQAAARAMVSHCGGNKTEAAQALAIARTRLYRLLDGKEV